MKKTTPKKKKLTAREQRYKMYGSRKVYITHMICLCIILATMAGSILLSVFAKSHTTEKLLEHLFLCGLALLLLYISPFVRTKFNLRIPAPIHIAVALFIIVHFVLGEIFRFYDYNIGFDKMLHISGGIIIALCGFSVVNGLHKTDKGEARLSPLLVAMFSFCFAATIFVLWECYEFLFDIIFKTNMQRWQDDFTNGIHGGRYWQGSGLTDTMWDMLVGMAAAAVVCLVCGLLLKKNTDLTQICITKEVKGLKLIFPTEKHKKQVESFKRKLAAVKGDFSGCGNLEDLNFGDWLTQCNDWREGKNLPDGYVPSSQFVAVRADDGKLVGMLQIRHNINGPILECCGHIGYSVLPEERRKGYATRMLKLALRECKKLGLAKVLVSCANDNTASVKTIERNGGVFADEVEYGVETLRRYWFTTE